MKKTGFYCTFGQPCKGNTCEQSVYVGSCGYMYNKFLAMAAPLKLI